MESCNGLHNNIKTQHPCRRIPRCDSGWSKSDGSIGRCRGLLGTKAHRIAVDTYVATAVQRLFLFHASYSLVAVDSVRYRLVLTQLATMLMVMRTTSLRVMYPSCPRFVNLMTFSQLLGMASPSGTPHTPDCHPQLFLFALLPCLLLLLPLPPT